MKRALLPLLIWLVATSAIAADHVCIKRMPKDVEAKLTPVLVALDVAHRKKDIWDKSYERAFERLIAAKGIAAVQARVALMDYNIGESFGESLVCAVAKDGAQSMPFLKLYEACDIAPQRLLITRKHVSPLRGYALKIIQDGTLKASCTYE